MINQEQIRGFIAHTPDSFFRGLPQSASMIITALQPLTRGDSQKIEESTNAIVLSPSQSVFIPDGKWGITTSFGPCSLAVLTGLDKRIWMGHLKPGTGLPSYVLPTSKSFIGEWGSPQLTLIGACHRKNIDMNAARTNQMETIKRQISEAQIDIPLRAFWNPYPNTWLAAFVRSVAGSADVYIGFEA
jgi:hypothetical protein